MKQFLAHVPLCLAVASCVWISPQNVFAAEGIVKDEISIQSIDYSNSKSTRSHIEPAESKAVSGDKANPMVDIEQKRYAISLQNADLSAQHSEISQQSTNSQDPLNNNRRLPNRSQTAIRSLGLQN